MCSRKSYLQKNENKEDKMVQTDDVFYMTEKEETMLTFIRIFKINIASLSTLCYGVVYNYSKRRYSIDTEPIETDSEDDEPPPTMETVDDLTFNKLIEESQKNKNLIYNLIKYKADNKNFQLIKDRQKAMAVTKSSGSTKASKPFGVSTDSGLDIVEVTRNMSNSTTNDLTDEMGDLNIRSIQPVNPRSIILNKWSKDKQKNTKQRHSPLGLLDVQIIPPQKKQDEMILQHQCKAFLNHMPENPISTSQSYPIQQNHQREHHKLCNFVFPSHMQLFDQSRSVQNFITPPNEEHNSSPQLYQLVNDKQMQPNLDYVMSTMSQPTAPHDKVRETQVEYPIPLLKKGTSETLNQRLKSVCNPKPGNEYTSPHIRAYYPPPPLDRIPFLPDDNLPFVNLTLADNSQTNQMREAESQMKNLQKQKVQQQQLQCQRQQNQQQQQLQYQQQQQLQHQEQQQLQHQQQQQLQHQQQQQIQYQEQQQLQCQQQKKLEHYQEQQLQHQDQPQLQQYQQQQLQLHHQQQLLYQQQLQHQKILQQINQQQLDNSMFHHVDVLQNQAQRQQSSQPPPPPPPPPPTPQIILHHQYRPPPAASVPLESSMQTEIWPIPPSYGNPVSHTSSNNSLPYINDISANVQPAQMRPPPPPPPIFANQTQKLTKSPGKEYSSRRMNHTKRNNLRYACIDYRPTASNTRAPEAYTRTSSNQMWPYPGQQYRYPAMTPRPHRAATPRPQDYQDGSARFQQTSGWPQSTSFNPYDTSRH